MSETPQDPYITWTEGDWAYALTIPPGGSAEEALTSAARLELAAVDQWHAMLVPVEPSPYPQELISRWEEQERSSQRR